MWELESLWCAGAAQRQISSVVHLLLCSPPELWQFSTFKLLFQHFAQAVHKGEKNSYVGGEIHTPSMPVNALIWERGGYICPLSNGSGYWGVSLHSALGLCLFIKLILGAKEGEQKSSTPLPLQQRSVCSGQPELQSGKASSVTALPGNCVIVPQRSCKATLQFPGATGKCETSHPGS